jgi:hypothetical protein
MSQLSRDDVRMIDDRRTEMKNYAQTPTKQQHLQIQEYVSCSQ